MDKKVVDVLKSMPERHKFIRGQIAWSGFRQTGIPYVREARHIGQSGYPLSKMIKFALDGITGFSDAPLRLVTYLGLFSCIISLGIALYALYSRFILMDYVQGWASLMMTMLFIGGIQLIAMGIMGEYMIRMNADTRQRPLYIIKDKKI